jgi:type II secretory pathway pseudopilin PulG
MTTRSLLSLVSRDAARAGERGMSLIEASIVLSVFALLSAVMAPAINGYIDTARQARARQDVTAIADAIQQFVTDNAESHFLLLGSLGTQAPPDRSDTFRIDLLVSDGDIPTLGSGVSTETFWTQAVDVVSNFTVDTLANHLGQNTPFDDTYGSFPYRTPAHIAVGGGGNNIDFARAESGGYNAPYAWRGAYLSTPVRPDPWGNRYAVNVGFLKSSTTTAITGITAGFATTDYPRLDVFVLSAGPDEEIDTRSAQDGAVPGDDDVIYIVSSHAK